MVWLEVKCKRRLRNPNITSVIMKSFTSLHQSTLITFIHVRASVSRFRPTNCLRYFKLLVQLELSYRLFKVSKAVAQHAGKCGSQLVLTSLLGLSIQSTGRKTVTSFCSTLANTSAVLLSQQLTVLIWTLHQTADWFVLTADVINKNAQSFNSL